MPEATFNKTFTPENFTGAGLNLLQYQGDNNQTQYSVGSGQGIFGIGNDVAQRLQSQGIKPFVKGTTDWTEKLQGMGINTGTSGYGGTYENLFDRFITPGLNQRAQAKQVSEVAAFNAANPSQNVQGPDVPGLGGIPMSPEQQAAVAPNAPGQPSRFEQGFNQYQVGKGGLSTGVMRDRDTGNYFKFENGKHITTDAQGNPIPVGNGPIPNQEQPVKGQIINGRWVPEKAPEGNGMISTSNLFGNQTGNQGYTRDAKGNVYDAQGNHVTYESLPKGPNGKPLMNLETLPLKGANQQFQQPQQSKESGVGIAMTGGVSPGEGRTAVTENVKPEEIPPSPQVTDFLTQDQGMGAIIKSVQDYMNSANQRTSLTDTYNQMLKDSGIQALDTQLMDMNKVINGTEEDIRNEITKSGGFATDSQVLALTDARNKQLIKNYNNLLEARNNKERYLNTMIGLTEKDRAEANNRFDRGFNMTMQIADYGQKMQQNAVDKMKWLVDKQGFDGLYNSTGGDSHAINLIEKTLGLPQGGLAKEAEQAKQKRVLDQAKEARVGQPVSVQEYEYAKANGYKGTYTQYQNEDANRKVKVSGGTPEVSGITFTTTQLNKGAAAAGVSSKDFAKFSPQGANAFVNSQPEINNFKKIINNAKINSENPRDLEREISEGNSPPEVKNYLVTYLKQVFKNEYNKINNPSQNSWKNLWGLI